MDQRCEGAAVGWSGFAGRELAGASRQGSELWLFDVKTKQEKRIAESMNGRLSAI